MIHFTIEKDSTSVIIPVSIYDSASTTGGKLTGLVFNTASLTAYYNRMGAAGAATAISLVTATKGTWVSSGFVAIDGTNMPGDYELHLPNAVLATGANDVIIQLKGAANMVPVNIQVELIPARLTVAGIQSGLATQASVDAIDDLLDTEITTLTNELAKVPKSDSNVTWNATALASLQAEATDALNAYDPPTRAELTTDTNSILTAVGDVPTNAELATALAAADDAVLAAIAALNNLSAAQVNAECDTAISDAALATAANLATVAGYLDTEIAAILADTNELQTDWANGGRLDLIIDAILEDTGTTLPGQIDDIGIKKNTAFSNFEFLMVLAADHVTPATGLTVTGQRSIDGAAFASVSGTIAEVSNGIYQFDAAAADTNGDVITWRFSSATADDAFITFKTVA